MAELSGHWAFAFGVLGNVVSFFIYLSPLPTFYNIYKKKSTEGYQSIPYVVALFSAMLWIYYAFLKTNTTLLITINSFGCLIETIYVGFYLSYAPKQVWVQTIKLLLLLMVGGFGAIVLVTQFLFKGVVRAQVVGWICLVFSLCVFAAPLCKVRQVIKTKSVECMPFLLSVFLTLSAVMWFLYGFLLKDFNIAVPNTLGFTFGVLQMVLHVMYNKKEENFVKERHQLPGLKNNVIVLHNHDKNLPELSEEQIIEIVKLGSLISCTHKFDLALCMHENIAEDYVSLRKTLEI
ncbi:unnamed protein product [Withania somnifera]